MYPPYQNLMITPMPSKPFEIDHADILQAQGQKLLTVLTHFQNMKQA